jgi:hypothetical protein
VPPPAGARACPRRLQPEEVAAVQTKHKVGLASVLAAATFGVVGASAANLGSLSSRGVGSQDTGVASCDTNGVNLAYTTRFLAAQGRFVISGVRVTGLASPACNRKVISVVVKSSAVGPAGTTATFRGTIGVNATAITLTGATLPASALKGASVLVTG